MSTYRHFIHPFSPIYMSDHPLDMEDAERISVPSSTLDFPPCPEGDQEVIVVSARFEMREAYNPTDPPKPTVTLRLETTKAKYKSKDGKERGYGGLWKSLAIGDNKKSHMKAFFEKVVGMPVPLSPEKTIDIKTVKETKVNKEGEPEVVSRVPGFENMRLIVNVVHEKKDDGSLKTKVASFRATKEEQDTNASIFKSMNE